MISNLIKKFFMKTSGKRKALPFLYERFPPSNGQLNPRELAFPKLTTAPCSVGLSIRLLFSENSAMKYISII